MSAAVRTSIIMPVYQTAEHLVDAVRSVLAQTDSDFELIVLNDASPDDSAQRLAAFLQAQPDPRVQVLNFSSNRGVSAVRNEGLARARGSWIAFLDSDDRYQPDFLETMHTYAYETGSEIVQAAHMLVDSSGQTSIRQRTNPGLYTGQQAARLLLQDQLTPYIWDKLFSADLLQGLSFKEDIHRAEDAIFVLEAAQRASYVTVCPRALYRYTVENTGLTWGRITPVSESIRLMEYMREAAADLLADPAGQRAFSISQLITFLNNAQQALLSSSQQAAQVIDQCRQEIHWQDIVHATYQRPVFAAAASLLKISPKLYHRLYGSYVKKTYGLD
ncbi:MAG: glycosyltransferase family 2 protein [Rothia sp. (in: high G+C Gram-positive bacteria)]|nr:glycosyltransferase family 2 protein [Rothia sp. (in: high G+C Gram-positive bacteria)]